MPLLQHNVIVLEPNPHWTPRLQRQFSGEEVRVRQCVRIVDLQRQVGDESVLVLDFDAVPAECLQFLGRRAGRSHSRPTIVIGSRETADLEWTARDLGALSFLVDAPKGHELARLCRRQWTLDGS